MEECISLDIPSREGFYLNAQNKKIVLKTLISALEIGLNFKIRDDIYQSLEYEEIFHVLNEVVPTEGNNIISILKMIEEKVIPYSTNFSSPYAMAFPDAGNSVASIAGAILSDLLNQNLINWKPCSPVGTIIEIIVLNWIRELLDFPFSKYPKTPLDVGGVITSGGVSSNTIALLYAREKAFPMTMKNGISEINSKYVIIVPNAIEHYSSRLAMGWIGLGEQNVIKAPTREFKYDLNELSSIMKEITEGGKKIIQLTAYAGDSRSMTCDNFVALRELCDRYGVWFHIDGCHGTQLLFSKKFKYRLKGIELADSVTLDPHKVLSIPYSLSILMLRDTKNLKLCHRPEDIITGEEHSFGQITPFFGSRSFASLKLYFFIKNLGLNGISEMIDRRHEMACILANKIKKRNNLILINPKIDINSVIFMFLPKRLKELKITSTTLETLNWCNSEIQKRLLDSGKVWLHNFNIPDLSNIFGLDKEISLRPLRFMSGNPTINEEHLDQMLDSVEKCGIEIVCNNKTTFQELINA